MPRAQFWANQWDQSMKMPVDTGIVYGTGLVGPDYTWSGGNGSPVVKQVQFTSAMIANLMRDTTPFGVMLEVYFDFYAAGGTANADLDIPAWGYTKTFSTIKNSANVAPVRLYVNPPDVLTFRSALDNSVIAVKLGASNSSIGSTCVISHFCARLFWIPIPTYPLGYSAANPPVGEVPV